MNYRAIHSDVAISESLALLSHGAERLFWRMLAQSDPWGCLPSPPSKIRALCVPTLDGEDGRVQADVEDVRSWLAELKRAGRIGRHRSYVEIVDFDLWQPHDFLRRRGPSRLLHPDGIPADETRPHDSRRKRARGSDGRFSAKSTVARHDGPSWRPKEKKSTSLTGSAREGASARAGAFSQARQFVRNSGWRYGDTDLRAALTEYDLTASQVAELRRLAIELRAKHGDG